MSNTPMKLAWGARRGSGLVEYLLILTFISLVLVTLSMLTDTGTAVSGAYDNLVQQVGSL